MKRVFHFFSLYTLLSLITKYVPKIPTCILISIKENVFFLHHLNDLQNNPHSVSENIHPTFGTLLPSYFSFATHLKTPPSPLYNKTECHCHSVFIYYCDSSTSFIFSFILALSRFKISFKYLPVYERSSFTTCSGVPEATICPPLSPPSGPRSTI